MPFTSFLLCVCVCPGVIFLSLSLICFICFDFRYTKRVVVPPPPPPPPSSPRAAATASGGYYYDLGGGGGGGGSGNNNDYYYYNNNNNYYPTLAKRRGLRDPLDPRNLFRAIYGYRKK